ncbi:ubiquitin carboxyl-terminal hydrolase isozyme L5-like [Oppia nitens]|uniref:ubiquitin carboxyl-terminal hydrolase isozyme L5-like n=1 Tax=Oppia nitens TaxID=1686743 RepID=UPI0023D9CD11|nr:ubiquitin carboxyl-terminal hydrolase isozyme L5-like [Oppia nitens]
MAEPHHHSAGDWCLIESDPGVFTELIRGFGVNGVQVEELYSLSPDCFVNLKPIHGLIFLFKWMPSTEPEGTVVDSDNIFFAKQVINNACATQAIINILLNCKHDDIQLGQTLTDLKEFIQNFDPTMKGLALSNSDIIKQVHNSFARQQMFEFEVQKAQKDDDVFHFISYLPIDGHLYELDGLKSGPILLGDIPNGTDWIDTARPHIEKRMQKYAEGEIHFNLMAIISDKKMLYEKQLQTLQSQIENGNSMDTDSAEIEITQLKSLIAEEETKLKRYKIENIRRKHNYLPLIMEILKTLAQEGRLTELVEKAKQKAVQIKKVKDEKKSQKT